MIALSPLYRCIALSIFQKRNDKVIEQLQLNNRLMAVEDDTYNLLTNNSRTINWRPAPAPVEHVIDIDLDQLGDGEIDLTPANGRTPKRDGTLLFIQNEQNRRRRR